MTAKIVVFSGRFDLQRFVYRTIIAVLFIGLGAGTLAQAQSGSVRLQGHLPHKALANAQRMGDLDPQERFELVVTLPFRNEDQLRDLISRFYNSRDSSYRKFLTTQEFNARFAPSSDDVNKVITFARKRNLHVISIASNRRLIKVSGSAADIGKAFSVHFYRYQAADGRLFRAPSDEPSVPSDLADHISSIVGLDTANDGRRRANKRIVHSDAVGNTAPGSGVIGGYLVTDIMRAYDLSATTQSQQSLTGLGQTVALYELEPFEQTDIEFFQSNQPSLTFPTITPVLVDGGSSPGDESESTLDIEVLGPMIPSGTILVYEGPDTDAGTIDTFSKIADDNSAQVVSSSYGLAEEELSSAELNAENAIFEQMAAQGQTVLNAAGDSGAYTDSYIQSPTVCDPASQVYVTGVGGTSLSTTGSGFSYTNEVVWNDKSGAGGGGVSTVWPLPEWQASIGGASTAFRNVPDVSLNADPNVGYTIYVTDCVDGRRSCSGWNIIGGTSAGTPIWAGFVALANEARSIDGRSQLGFLNPWLYELAASASSGTFYHDITTGNNLYYSAKSGYDNATGWGSFIGDPLLRALAADTTTQAPVPSPTPLPTSIPTPIPTVVPIATSTPSPVIHVLGRMTPSFKRNTRFSTRYSVEGLGNKVTFALTKKVAGISISSTGIMSGKISKRGNYIATIKAHSSRGQIKFSVTIKIT